MMKRLLLVLLLLAGAIVFTLPASPVYAANPLCDADLNNLPAGTDPNTVNQIQQSEACKSQRGGSDPLTGPGGLLSDITTIVAVVAGIIAVVMIMYGGYQYITSGGESSKVQDAKKTITWSVIGLIVTVFARTIIVFVINRV